MYAVIKAGGKQHKVKTGDVLEIELMQADGDTVTFQPLLVVDDDGKTHYGKEAAQAVVTAKLLGETLIEIADVKLGSAPKRAAAQKPAAKRATEPAKDDAAEPEAAEAAE